MIIRQQLAGAINGPPTPQELEAAKEALDSPRLSALRHAVTAPLTPKLFLANMAGAYDYTKLRIPADPVAAAARFDE